MLVFKLNICIAQEKESVNTKPDDVNSEDAPIIKIEQGILIGQREEALNGRDFFSFRSIPFAEPPTGVLRFKVIETYSFIILIIIMMMIEFFRVVYLMVCLTQSTCSLCKLLEMIMQ